MDGWNTTFLLRRPIFRGHVSFREGISWERVTLVCGGGTLRFPWNRGHCIINPKNALSQRSSSSSQVTLFPPQTNRHLALQRIWELKSARTKGCWEKQRPGGVFFVWAEVRDDELLLLIIFERNTWSLFSPNARKSCSMSWDFVRNKKTHNSTHSWNKVYPPRERSSISGESRFKSCTQKCQAE